MLLAADYPFLGVFWSMLVFFLWISLVHAAVPRYRRHLPAARLRVARKRRSGSSSCSFVPFLGVFVYLIANSDDMTKRDIDRGAGAAGADGRVRAHDRRPGGAAAEIEKAKGLLDTARSPRPSSTRSRPRPWPRRTVYRVRRWVVFGVLAAFLVPAAAATTGAAARPRSGPTTSARRSRPGPTRSPPRPTRCQGREPQRGHAQERRRRRRERDERLRRRRERARAARHRRGTAGQESLDQLADDLDENM